MSWPERIHENTLIAASGEDEFTNFLEFNMHFPDLEGHGPAHSQLQDQQHSLGPPTTTASESAMASDPRSHHQYSAPMEGLAMDFNGHGPVQSHPGSIPYSTPSMTPGFCAQDSSQQSAMPQRQPPADQHYLQGQPMIPPTPNSMELHGNAARYPQRVDENSEMYDRYSRMHEEQVWRNSPSLPLTYVHSTHFVVRHCILRSFLPP